jgi:hypothetical protein
VAPSLHQSSLLDQLRKSQGLLRAVDAVTHKRAFLTLFGTFISVGLLIAIMSTGVASLAMNGHTTGSAILGFVGFVAIASTIMVGSNATGFLLNDSMRGLPEKSIGQALLTSVSTVHRVLGLLLALGAIALVLIIALVLVLLVCKIPGVGPVLYFVAFPVCAVIMGLGFNAIYFIFSLHGPAIWSGFGITEAISMLATIFRCRLLSVLIQLILLSMLVVLVASIVFGTVFMGVILTGAISVPVIGSSLGGMGITGMVTGMMAGGVGGATGYVIAGSMGMVLLFAAAATVPALMAIAGNCVVFANATEGLSTAEFDEKIKSAVDSTRAATEAARRKLEETRQELQAASKPVDAPHSVVSLACPKCSAPYVQGDTFCGGCGHRIS